MNDNRIWSSEQAYLSLGGLIAERDAWRDYVVEADVEILPVVLCNAHMCDGQYYNGRDFTLGEAVDWAKAHAAQHADRRADVPTASDPDNGQWLWAGLRDRISQAVHDPGNVVGGRRGPSWGDDSPDYADEQESLWDWVVRAVMAVIEADAARLVQMDDLRRKLADVKAELAGVRNDRDRIHAAWRKACDYNKTLQERHGSEQHTATWRADTPDEPKSRCKATYRVPDDSAITLHCERDAGHEGAHWSAGDYREWTDAEEDVRWWNDAHPVGTRVRYWRGVRSGPGAVGTTRTPAQVLNGDEPVVWIDGTSGCIALTHVEPLSDAPEVTL